MHTNYVSQLLRIPPGTLQEMLVDIGPAPDRPTGMFLTGNENNTWMFTVFGMVGHQPPRDLAGMLSFAQDYCPDHLIAALRAAEPVADPHEVAAVDWWRWEEFVGAALAADSWISPWAQEQVRRLHSDGHVARFLVDLTQDQSTCNR